jgi:hypothetical protein
LSKPKNIRIAFQIALATPVKAIAEDYLTREAGMRRDAEGKATFQGENIRSGDERRSTFERLVFPRLGPRCIGEIKRSDILRRHRG